MAFSIRSSRRRYQEYRSKLKQRLRDRGAAGHGDHGSQDPHGSSSHSHGDPRRTSRARAPSSRSSAEFWGLLAGYRCTLILVLLALGISTLLGLVPLYGTKIVFDSVLREQPLPARAAALDSSAAPIAGTC